MIPSPPSAESVSIVLRFIHVILGGRERPARQLLAERKRKRFDARVEELDLERPIFNRTLLANQLEQPMFVDDAVALLVDVGAGVLERRRAVEGDAEPHGFAA